MKGIYRQAAIILALDDYSLRQVFSSFMIFLIIHDKIYYTSTSKLLSAGEKTSPVTLKINILNIFKIRQFYRLQN